MSSLITLKKRASVHGTASSLPASKSISNRVLIMNALSGNKSVLHNLSEANDTRLMASLLQSDQPELDVEDAGTTMRFLTAYLAITNQKKVITGTARMKERPIGILVEALRSLGANVGYLEREGYPPLAIDGFSSQKNKTIQIRGDVSSQFISALMMMAPVLPYGLGLELTGRVGSRPYIEMTAALMKVFGVASDFTGNTIVVKHQDYKPAEFTVESDWSAASYWFAFAALADDAVVELPRLSLASLQGDSAAAGIMDKLGVKCVVGTNDLLKLTKKKIEGDFRWDFTHCPDLAQTVAVVCAAKGIPAVFTGLESLRIKETDRIAALQVELGKIGAALSESPEGWRLNPSAKLPASVSIHTYKDHRMAMAFAPLAAKMDVAIDDPAVVRKSYPSFWEDVKRFGFVE